MSRGGVNVVRPELRANVKGRKHDRLSNPAPSNQSVAPSQTYRRNRRATLVDRRATGCEIARAMQWRILHRQLANDLHNTPFEIRFQTEVGMSRGVEIGGGYCIFTLGRSRRQVEFWSLSNTRSESLSKSGCPWDVVTIAKMTYH